MYKLLVVDDERAMREGIAKSVQWETIGVGEVFKASNGLEALDIINREHPHIIITDIMMPEINGLELIDIVKERFPETEFVILSGYGDFEYAQKAMGNEVMHYLLKPCSAEDILRSVSNALLRLKAREDNRNSFNKIRESLNSILPQAKEKFFHDYLLGAEYRHESMALFTELLGIGSENYRIVLFKISDSSDTLDLMAAGYIINNSGEKEHILLSAVVEASLVIMTDITEFGQLVGFVEGIKDNYQKQYNIDLTVAVSERDTFENIPKMYLEVKNIIRYAFYLGEGRIIAGSDIAALGIIEEISVSAHTERISTAVGSGNLEEVERTFESLSRILMDRSIDINVIKSISMEFYSAIIKRSSSESLDRYIKQTGELLTLGTALEIRDFLHQTAIEIAKEKYSAILNSQSKIIKTVINYVNENLSDESLTLHLIASKILYINVDYLGKLFKKKTEMKFTNYLLEKRMERAKEIIRNSDDLKIYELAEQVGFGSNSSYFSQMFKKYTGCSPREYREQNR